MIIPSPRSKRKARIEIIPLIDIVFFLLATFVMVSPSMVKSRGIGVNLPKAETATRQEMGGDKSSVTVVTVTARGEIYVNKEMIAQTKLADYFKNLKARNKDPQILVNGDDQAVLGKVIFILDEARKAGIHHFAFSAKQP